MRLQASQVGRRISDPMSTTPKREWIEGTLFNAIQAGFIEVIYSDDGVLRYKITELGVKHLQAVIDGKEEE